MNTLFEKAYTVEPLAHKLKDAITDGIGEGWNTILKNINGDEKLLGISQELVNRATMLGEKIYPASSDVMGAFKKCKYSRLKVIFIGQDPYHQPATADGMAFSCSKTGKEQPSLKLIFDEIQRTAYHYKFSRNPDLTRWAEQGVLLLNTALTVKEATPESHLMLWHGFTSELIKEVSTREVGMIWVLVGSKAKPYGNLIDRSKHTVFEVVHPAYSARLGGAWDSQNVFNNINQVLKSLNKDAIEW